MTIENYIEKNHEWDIDNECELSFVEPDNSKEAKKNIEWVLENNPTFETLAIVIRSYYDDTIEW